MQLPSKMCTGESLQGHWHDPAASPSSWYITLLGLTNREVVSRGTSSNLVPTRRSALCMSVAAGVGDQKGRRGEGEEISFLER